MATQRKIMKVEASGSCIGCNACSRVCPKNCQTHVRRATRGMTRNGLGWENRGTDKDALVAGALTSGNWESAPTTPRDPFSVHVFNCMVAPSPHGINGLRRTIGETLGLCSADLDALVTTYPSSIAVRPGGATLGNCILTKRKSSSRFVRSLSRRRFARNRLARLHAGPSLHVAEPSLARSRRLSTRGDLNRLMRERFPALAARNTQNMKWKHFYRCLCEMEGFSSSRPSCAECSGLYRLLWKKTRASASRPRCVPRKSLKLLSDKGPLDHPRTIVGGPLEPFV